MRHSALFALPAILPRLSPELRRSLSLESIIPLAADNSHLVHTGVLEALGEVIYAFHQDPEGPPEELVRIFLDRNLLSSPYGRHDNCSMTRTNENITGLPLLQRGIVEDVRWWETAASSSSSSPNGASSHALICAFNFPAVALTLGRSRWDDLREVYLELAAVEDTNVRRTLAASLGELARIIGPENARRDLVGVWQDAVRCQDANARMRALGCLETFSNALRGAPGTWEDPGGERMSAMLGVVEYLLSSWNEGRFGSWKERDGVVKALPQLIKLVGGELPMVFRSLFKLALEDGVAAVREAAVSTVSETRLFKNFYSVQGLIYIDPANLGVVC